MVHTFPSLFSIIPEKGPQSGSFFNRLTARGHTFGVRVDGASPRRFLRFVSLTAFQAEGCGGGFAFGHTSGVRVHRVQKVQKVQRVVVSPLRAMSMKLALRDSPFCVIWHDKHSADWLAALASPFPAAPDFPLCRGKNKTPRNTLFISRTTISTDYSAPVEVLHRTSKWGEARHLACPLRRFPFAAPPNCGGGKGTGFIGEL